MDINKLSELVYSLAKADIHIPVQRLELVYEEYLLLKEQMDTVNSQADKPNPANVFTPTKRSEHERT